MSVFDRFKTMARRATESGRAQAEDLRLRRRRGDLLRQLGEAAYGNAKGQPGLASEIDRLVDEIDQLEASSLEGPAESPTVEDGGDPSATPSVEDQPAD